MIHNTGWQTLNAFVPLPILEEWPLARLGIRFS